MKRKQVLILLLTGCMLMAACNKEKDTQPPTNSSTFATEDTPNDGESEAEPETTAEAESSELNVETPESETSAQKTVNITYETEEEEIKGEGDDIILSYAITYPTVEIKGNLPAQDLINKDLQAELETMHKDKEGTLREATEFYEMSENNEFYAPSYLYYDYASLRADEGIISFERQSSTYLGGAHGNALFEGLNYDGRTGKRLTLDDIFTDRASSMEQIREHVLYLASQPYYSELMFPDYEEYIDSIFEEGCWTLDKDGLHFISNEYVLGPYASGKFDFIIPYEKIPGLKAEYRYDSFLLHTSMVGEPITCDLDGDGEEDTITYGVINPFASYQLSDESLETSFTLEINGTDFSEELMSAAQAISDNFCNQYYVVDLDERDPYKELLIVDYNYNDYNLSHFFRYENNTLKYIGTIPDAPSNESFRVNGDGTVNAIIHANLLQTTRFQTVYEIKDGTLSPVDTDWYKVDDINWSEEYRFHKILKDVTVYKEADLASETITLTSEDGPVSFPATDNKNWYQIKTKDGQIYYLYMTEFLTVPNGGTDMDATEIFENLFLAG